MNFDEKARAAIESIIKPWTSKYLYNITLIDSTTPEQVYMVQFSLPTSAKPIPIATVQVYFYIEPTTPLNIKFKFQKDSLVHTVNQTIRSSQMQNLIESLLHKKLLIRQNVFYLGTDYEVTRVKDARQDKILEQKIIPVQEQYVFISPDLLIDQKRSIQMDSKPISTAEYQKMVYNSFIQIDKQGLGVITNSELIEILTSLQLKLDEMDIEQIIAKIDKNKEGLVTFDEYKQIGNEISKCMITKNDAISKLKNNEEEYELFSIMILINNNIHNIQEKVIEKFKKIDEDELGYLRLPDIKIILEQINVEILKDEQEKINKRQVRTEKPPSKLKQGQKKRVSNKSKSSEETAEAFLTLMELEQFTKKLSQKYPFSQVKYHGIVKQLLQFKLNNLKKGLLDSNQTILQVYLKQLFLEKDNDRLNKIHISQMINALQNNQKIKLTKGQLYVIKSIVDKDSKDMVNYLTTSKLLAEVLKRMYMTHEKRREAVEQKTEMEKEMQREQIEQTKINT